MWKNIFASPPPSSLFSHPICFYCLFLGTHRSHLSPLTSHLSTLNSHLTRSQSMARLRRSHQAGKLGSRASMTSLTDVAEEEGSGNADNQYASADEDEQQQQQQQQHAVDGEWPPLANIKKFSTADEVHSGMWSEMHERRTFSIIVHVSVEKKKYGRISVICRYIYCIVANSEQWSHTTYSFLWTLFFSRISPIRSPRPCSRRETRGDGGRCRVQFGRTE
jgi:hypothetical protein